LLHDAALREGDFAAALLTKVPDVRDASGVAGAGLAMT